MGIRSKLLMIIAGILIAVLSVQMYLQMSIHKKAFDQELEQRTHLLKENLKQRVFSQAENLKHLVTEYIASYKLFELNNTVNQAAIESADLAKVVVLDKLNQVYVDSSKPGFSGIYLPDPNAPSDKTLAKKADQNEAFPSRLISFKHEEAIEFTVPITIGQERWGKLLLVYSLSELNKQINSAYQAHEQEQHDLFIKTILITLSILILASIFISQISKRLIAPIITLTEHTKDLARGDFSQIKAIDQPRQDEIGILTHNFITMAQNLEQSHKELANYNQTLEQTVNSRTYALNLKNVALKKALAKLEDSQQQLIHSEKMAALGQLIAGIAHEINTPLGAIQASAGNNSKSFRHFEGNLPSFLNTMAENDKLLLSLLLNKSIHKIERGIIYSTREERQQKKRILNALLKYNTQDAEALTELLLDMVEVEDIDYIAPYLIEENALKVVSLAHNLSALERNNQTILTAISKASKVVFSLKNFSHHDNSGNKILSNINHGIKTVLVLYQNFLKQGCEVIEEYQELPDILCFPDELNQVWTNLIHNALHAMQNMGTLTINTTASPTEITVKISDNGSGIPKEIQTKVFDSFFTTKPAGEGSGLGLGICKRIIDKHDGQISLESMPGKTTFTVTLPILEA